MNNFQHYVLGFYGKGGVYEFNAPKEIILKACDLVSSLSTFEGDTLDRERVREVLQALWFKELEKPPVSSDVMLEAVHAHYDSILSPWKF
jgi:hypothetical protein